VTWLTTLGALQRKTLVTVRPARHGDAPQGSPLKKCGARRQRRRERERERVEKHESFFDLVPRTEGILIVGHSLPILHRGAVPRRWRLDTLALSELRKVWHDVDDAAHAGDGHSRH